MPGLVTGQAFTQDELDTLLAWYVALGMRGAAMDDDDRDLADKVRRYRNELDACLVP
jgi:hypothetical protein